MSYPKPPVSKGAVKRAGRAISNNAATSEDYDLVDQWRASHGYVINTFQAWIKGHIGRQKYSVEFAQRLKRKKTVHGKLRRLRPDGTPLISDVSSMQDFAGCRLIFNTIGDLRNFRDYLTSSEVMRNVKHTLRYDPEKYDYILNPKSTGYRGVHDVFRHFPRRHRRNLVSSGEWDGLMVEVQYRTRAQHAWATAVEISDIVDGERTKFELEQSERGRFFAIASEIIARQHEGASNALNELTLDELKGELQALEDNLGVMQRLEVLRQFEVEDLLQRHNVLNIYLDDSGRLQLEVYQFSTGAPAIAKASELENDKSSVNAVYVRSDNPAQLRSTYRNYFNDPIDFVNLLRDEADLT